MASTYIYRNASSSVTSDTTFTFSMWFKRGKVGTNETLFCHENESSHTQKLDLHFVDDQFRMGWYNGSSEFNLDTKMVFRDPNAWYHLVFRYDTTQSTASDRVRIYVNGVLQELEQINGSDPTSQYPSQNITLNLGQKKMVYGRYQAASPSRYWCGSMSHLIYCDGQSYAPTEFGETDTTTGEWRIKDLTASDLTWGTNGHWLLKDGISLTDASSNSNNFTASGNLTKTEDNPSNNFCTLSPLMQRTNQYFSGNATSLVFAHGNTYAGKVTHGTYFGTIGVSSGKYYWEIKVEDTNNAFGIMAMRPTGGVTYGYSDATSNMYYPYSDYYYTNGVAGSNGSGDFDNTSNKIYSFALDATNNKLWIGRDGTFVGDPANGTGATWSSLPTGHDWTPVCHPMATTQENNSWFNFGNGYFGTTAISSEGTNASGIGKFEYNVPAGFTAISTKGLNE